MEIFIVGVIIVALMVYVSTRIKRSAAGAFEQETIETDEFKFVKSEGFLNPLNDESKFAFYAYSKEFGKEEAEEELRQAEIFIKAFADKTFAEVCTGIKNASENIVSEELSDAQKICLFESENTVEDIAVSEFYKIAESENTQKIYELKISVLNNFKEDYQERVDEMLESFRVK